MANKGSYTNPHDAIYLGRTSVRDKDRCMVELEIWQDPVSDGVFAIDSSFLEAMDDIIQSPFNERLYLRLGEGNLVDAEEGEKHTQGLHGRAKPILTKDGRTIAQVCDDAGFPLTKILSEGLKYFGLESEQRDGAE